ncbi:hypothetical protein GCM10010524_32350 [Streptomyces mexicanus]
MGIDEVDRAEGEDHVVRGRRAQVVHGVRVDQPQPRHVGAVGTRPFDLAAGSVDPVDLRAVGPHQVRGVPGRPTPEVQDPQALQVPEDLVARSVRRGAPGDLLHFRQGRAPPQMVGSVGVPGKACLPFDVRHGGSEVVGGGGVRPDHEGSATVGKAGRGTVGAVPLGAYWAACAVNIEA